MRNAAERIISFPRRGKLIPTRPRQFSILNYQFSIVLSFLCFGKRYSGALRDSTMSTERSTGSIAALTSSENRIDSPKAVR